MKIKLVALITLVVISIQSSAKELPGYIITLNSDTVRCTLDVKYNNTLSLIWGVKYYDSNNKKIKAKGEDLLGYGFEYEGELFAFRSFKYLSGVARIGLDKQTDKVFYRQRAFGRICVFEYNFNVDFAGPARKVGRVIYYPSYKVSSNSLCYTKGNGEMMQFGFNSFTQDFARLVEDYRELSDKVIKERMEIDAVFFLVAEYNEWYDKTQKK